MQLGWHTVAVVQYTFTQKQCTEQDSEAEYIERNIHNNKNTYEILVHKILNRSIQNIQPYI